MTELAALHKRLHRVATVLTKLADEGVLSHDEIRRQEKVIRDEQEANDKAVTASVFALETGGLLAYALEQGYGMLKEVDALYAALTAADKKLHEYANKATATRAKSIAYRPLRYNRKSTTVEKPSGVKNKAAARRVKMHVTDITKDISDVLSLYNDELTAILTPVQAAVDAAVSAVPKA